MSGIVKKGAGGAELTDVISMRLAPEDRHLLDVVSKAIPAIPRLTLARIAMRLGLEEIRQNPARALGAPQGRRQAR
jgi:hypothetical protein